MAEGFFHVTTHAVREELLFPTDRTRVHFLRELARAVAHAGWTCLAHCLMGTHYHLLLKVDDNMLPRGMHSLNFRYASWFNAEHGHRGHAMAARYWARRIGNDVDLLGTYAYVARNPVEAFLCDRPEEWLWSSYAGTIGLREADSFIDANHVTGCFAGSHELRLAELRRYVSGA